PAFFMALSSCLSADCTSATHFRALAAVFFISCTSPRAIAPRIGSPYGGTGPVSDRAALLDFLVDFLVADLRVGIRTSETRIIELTENRVVLSLFGPPCQEFLSRKDARRKEKTKKLSL